MMLKNLWYKNGFAIEDLNSQWIFGRIYKFIRLRYRCEGHKSSSPFLLVFRAKHWETQWYRTNPSTTLTVKFYNVSDYPILTEHLSVF